jgi:hypothetical protein
MVKSSSGEPGGSKAQGDPLLDLLAERLITLAKGGAGPGPVCDERQS